MSEYEARKEQLKFEQNEIKNNFCEEELTIQWFINKIAWKLQKFMDDMIENDVFLLSEDE